MSSKNAYWTSGLISLPKASSDCINQKVEEALEPHKNGGISKGGLFGWLYHGSQLEVISTQTGERLAAWCCGQLLKDPTTTICYCVECVHNGSSWLILSTDSVMGGDMLLMFDVASSRVVKAIQMPYKVTSIAVISTPSSSEVPQATLGTHLQHLAGTLAVGTHCGHVYLIDMNLDDESGETDELNPAVLSYLSFNVSDIRRERYNAVSKGSHLCLQLNEDSKRGTFYYRKPDDKVVKSFPADSVCVSSLCWCQRTGQLAVGFSFGSFQLWRLSVPVMEYTGRYEDDLGPVSYFAYQEPENDPRNFCYLWVSRGALPSDHQVDYNSYLNLYQLGFNKKTWHDSTGYLLEDLISVGPRFEYELTTDPFNTSGKESCGSRLVSCYTLTDPNFRVPHRNDVEESFEDGCHSPDLSLCMFVWEAGYAEPKPSCYLAVFDMNRWYHAQMPYTVRPTSTIRNTCSYFAFYNLEEVMNTCDPAGLMAVHIPHSSLSKFHSLHVPAPEQHFYPSALSFDSCFLAENGLVQCKYLGAQKKLLADVQQVGPSLILDPTEYYLRATLATLLPRTLDVNATHSQVYKREALLSVTLEYGQLPFLNTCITDFGTGDFMLRGCSLRFFLEWCWKKVGSIKQEVDRLCHSLYDWSGVPLDKQTLQILHHHHSVLNRLVQLLTTLMNQPSTPLGHQDLEVKVHIATLLSQHLQMILWLYSAGFLPENSDEEPLSVGQYAYPLQVLRDTYRGRRLEVQRMHSDLQTSDVLHIDSIVERVGEPLQTMLTKDGGSAFYPFSSFHSLLNMFLLEDVTFKAKITLTFYILCDLYSLVEEEEQQKFSDKLQQFAQMFSMSVSLQKYVQGIWLLDHKDFKDSLAYLQDPGLSQDVESWQHTITIKAFLYQGHHSLALRYMRVMKPPLQTPEDIKLRLTVLLANGLTSEAFEYQRLCRDQLNADDLLSHLFVGSLQTKSVDQLLQLPFTEDEEHHLVNYLKTNSDLASQELLVMYYLQRARFIEAIRLNAKIRHSSVDSEKSGTRHCIVEGYQRVLPYVQRKLAFGTDQIVPKRQRIRREFTRPTPLSTTVNKSVGGVTVTRATLLQSVLEKTKEVQSEEREEGGQADMQDIEEEAAAVSRPEDPGPFVCTPMTDKVRRRVSEVSEVVFSKSRPSDIHLATSSSVFVSPTKNSPHRSLYKNASPYKQPDAIKSLKKKLTSAADLTLLHTPPVRKKTPPSKRPTLCRLDTPKTPQSILKVRQKPLRRTPSPLLFAHKAKSDLVMATPPVPKTRLARMAASQGPASPTVGLVRQDTPKKLRFSMPGRRGETPTPTEEIDPETPPPSTEKTGEMVADDDDASPTPRPPLRESMELEASVELKNMRDRSPTPERDSPKLSPKTDFMPVQSSTTPSSETMIDSDISFNLAGKYSSQAQHRIASRAPTDEEANKLDLEAMEEGDNSEDDYQETRENSKYKRDPSFDLTKHKKIETSMRMYKQSVLSVDEHKKGLRMSDGEVETSEEEHKEVEPSEDKYKEAESSEEEHKEAEPSGYLHKGVEPRGHLHQGVKISGFLYKETKSSVGQHDEVESSEEEHKEPESSNNLHRKAESTDYLDDESEISEEEHKEVESFENRKSKLPTDSKDLLSDSFRMKQTTFTSIKEKNKTTTSFYTKEKRVSFTTSSEAHIRDIETNDKTVMETDLLSENLPVQGDSNVSTAATSEMDQISDKDMGVTLSNNIQEQSVISGQPTTESLSLDTEHTFAATSTTDLLASEVQTSDNVQDLHMLKEQENLDAVEKRDEYEELHLQFDNDMDEEQLKEEEKEFENVPTENVPENVADVQEGETTPKAHSLNTITKTLIIDLTPVNVVTKEQADSSEDPSKEVPHVENVSPKPSQSVPLSPGRRTPTRKTPRKIVQEDPDLSLTPRRRSMRLASKDKTPEEPQKTPSKTRAGKTTVANKTPNKTPNKCQPLATIVEVRPHTADTPSPIRHSPRLTRRHQLDRDSCDICRENDTFRTPPRPTRLAMPPTPPESSPASTTTPPLSEEPPIQPPTPQATSPGRRGRSKKAQTTSTAIITPPRGSRTRKARSRSGSPPVVTSTTEDLPGIVEATEVDREVSEGPLSSNSFMMSLRTEKPARQPSPQFSDVSNQDDFEFTFSKPEEVQAFEDGTRPDFPSDSFIFSPPVTRQTSRRMSLTASEVSNASQSLLHSINLLPKLPEMELFKEQPTEVVALTKQQHQTPAKRPRRKAKTLKRDSPLCKPTDSPINFVPEADESLTAAGPSTRGMTLRVRNVKSKVPKKRKKPIMW